MRRLLLALAIACAAASGATAANTGAVSAHSSRFGRILFDGRGFVLYAFTKDRPGRSACSGACAVRWPPFVVKAKPVALSGVPARLLGTARRGDGRLQVTYAGRPLYLYVGDRSPGQILCQDVNEFGGLWLVVRPSGKPVRSS